MIRYTYSWANAAKTALKREDGAWIPVDPENTDYAEYLRSGTTAAEYEVEEPPVKRKERTRARK